MVMSDRIAIMREGRFEQIGSVVASFGSASANHSM